MRVGGVWKVNNGSWEKTLTLCEKFPYSELTGPYFPVFRLNTERYSIFSPNTGKYGLEKLQIRKLLTQWKRNYLRGLCHLICSKTFCFVNIFQSHTFKSLIGKLLKSGQVSRKCDAAKKKEEERQLNVIWMAFISLCWISQRFNLNHEYIFIYCFIKG